MQPMLLFPVCVKAPGGMVTVQPTHPTPRAMSARVRRRRKEEEGTEAQETVLLRARRGGRLSLVVLIFVFFLRVSLSSS